ncbi:hypothetical protein DAPPUDRAFT_324999 [Daphnia pulex]|uniref:RING-type domain-containing protein n=1 Tax=Daphnia pulex TaxID=6669 RepID=E9H3E4_DAPPU|nr:hypothetical protein DAPPUDRAFT_324999 [Daphnia pulex]|eukprot:EFX73792.1 hypothetical protein DAPPUDRAFT_324999 [Daphnia pulex]
MARQELLLNTMERMEIELRCGICSELMVSATTLLNCMHTFCQYCISQWQHFDAQRVTVEGGRLTVETVGCPVCRDVII